MIELAQRILEIIGSFAGLIFGTPEFKKLKIILMIISLTFSILALYYFFYLERKYKIGTSILITNIKNFLEAFLKQENFNQEWLKIKDIFLVDHLSALNKVYKYLNEIINLYEYPGNDLFEKYNQFPESVFNNKKDFLKAIKVLEVIKSKKEKLEISREEGLAIIRVIEKGLLELMIIDSQAQWATFLKLPED
jgi:hypothetical protein